MGEKRGLPEGPYRPLVTWQCTLARPPAPLYHGHGGHERDCGQRRAARVAASPARAGGCSGPPLARLAAGHAAACSRRLPRRARRCAACSVAQSARPSARALRLCHGLARGAWPTLNLSVEPRALACGGLWRAFLSARRADASRRGSRCRAAPSGWLRPGGSLAFRGWGWSAGWQRSVTCHALRHAPARLAWCFTSAAARGRA